MEEGQPDHFTPVQGFLAWESSPQTLRGGTVGPENEDTKEYIPKTAFDAYFSSPEMVKQLLEALFTDPRPDPYYICAHYCHSFAILLSIHQGPMIRRFTDFPDLQDTFLPFTKKPDNFPESSQADLFSAFHERQWRYYPRSLNCKMRGPIPADVILPFQVTGRVGRGRSATVDRIEVDQAYNQLSHPNQGASANRFYAMKTFRKNAERYFKTEKEAYEILNTYSKPPNNIIGFHGSFTRHGQYHLILEYADLGTLKDFMEQHHPPSKGEDILLFWSRLLGLLMGLQTLHQAGGQMSSSTFMSGWHQDIKPTNILVKSCMTAASVYDCQFVLADLGLSHFKSSNGADKDITDQDTYGTYAYGAPEAHRISSAVRDVRINVTRKVDVWSIGCIFSEVATWIGHGPSRVEQYRKEREKEVVRKLLNPEDDGDLFHDGVKVLDAVSQSHSSIQDSCRRDDFITLRVIKDVINNMLEPENVRADPLQAFNWGEKALRAASKELQAFRSGNTVLGQTNLVMSIHDQLPEQPASPDQNQMTTIENGSLSSYSKQRASSPQTLQNEALNNANSPPRISVENMRRWRTSKSFGIGEALPNQELLDAIKGRDSVFVIDNSASMKNHRDQARDVLAVLSYVVKRYDDNGIDMRCTSSGLRISSTERTKRLIRMYDELEFKGTTDMELKLDEIWQEYKAQMLGETLPFTKRLTSLFRGSPRAPKPLSLYILTDGIWQQGCDVEGVIKRIVDFLVNHDLHVKEVAIQFIRFGDANRSAIDLLDRLDDGLNLKRDIVDTTPANGNAWKMILGAIHTWFDKDNRPMTS